MRVCQLASGSKGNSLLLETDETRLLVDAGLSARELLRRLSLLGIDGCQLHGIVISHEHTDHVRGAGTLARRFKIPLFVSYPTHRHSEKIFDKTEVNEFESGCSFTYRDLLIDPFPITHDACDPVGFTIESTRGKLGIATDLGIATRLVREKLKQCRILVVEFNHDEEMLLNGPYPWHLKQRIKSRHGHLSNNDSADMLQELVHADLSGVFLAHLSEVNNDPTLAASVAVRLFESQNVCAPRIVLGDQYKATSFVTM